MGEKRKREKAESEEHQLRKTARSEHRARRPPRIKIPSSSGAPLGRRTQQGSFRKTKMSSPSLCQAQEAEPHLSARQEVGRGAAGAGGGQQAGAGARASPVPPQGPRQAQPGEENTVMQS